MARRRVEYLINKATDAIVDAMIENSAHEVSPITDEENELLMHSFVLVGELRRRLSESINFDC